MYVVIRAVKTVDMRLKCQRVRETEKASTVCVSEVQLEKKDFSNQIGTGLGWAVFGHLYLLRLKLTWRSLLEYFSPILFKILTNHKSLLSHWNGRNQNPITKFLCLNRKPMQKIFFPPQEGANPWVAFQRGGKRCFSIWSSRSGVKTWRNVQSEFYNSKTWYALWNYRAHSSGSN